MSLLQKINEDVKTAMKAKDQEKLGVLRMLTATIKNKKIEMKSSEDLNDEQVETVIASEIKKRKDSITSYEEGGREDLANQEKKEIEILSAYMPEQMSEEEVEKEVRGIISGLGEVDKSKFGQIMGMCMGKLKGKADGNAVKQAVEKVLSV